MMRKKRSCEWSGWMGEEERRFERLLESKEMYERLIGFNSFLKEGVFKKRRRMREGVTK